MGGIDKIFYPLMGRPIISYSIDTFNSSPLIDSIVLVVATENLGPARQLVELNHQSKVVDVCAGGTRRQDSVRRGLERLGDSDWIIIHDGARPFATSQLIEDGLRAASETGAAVAAVPVKDTIKTVGPDMIVTGTPSRDELWAAQTPQIIRMDLLTRAHQLVEMDATDDASMVEMIGGKVRVFMGSYDNIKITTHEDIPLAQAIVRSNGSKYVMSS